MKNEIEMGLNRSGLATAPRLAPQVLQVPKLTPHSSGDASVIANERIIYSRDSEPAATMPPPGSLKELATTTLKMIKGQKALVFVDKIGERMAFERAGTRLYEALLSKLEAFGSWEGGPNRSDLENILRDELQHFHLLAQVMGMLGADATAVTPSAEVTDLLSSGLRQVLTDPRINLKSSLEAVLQAELVDNDCWGTLVKLAVAYDETQLAERLQRCLDEERVHLGRIRGWLSTALATEAFGDPGALQVSEPWVKHTVAMPMRGKAASRVSMKRRTTRNINGNRNGNGRRK
jgi:hypothetical protein